jgi:hypothetical protein
MVFTQRSSFFTGVLSPHPARQRNPSTVIEL